MFQPLGHAANRLQAKCNMLDSRVQVNCFVLKLNPVNRLNGAYIIAIRLSGRLASIATQLVFALRMPW